MQPLKAELEIDVTELPKVTLVICEYGNTFVLNLLRISLLFSVTDVSLLQPLNALDPMELTLFGIDMDVNAVQLLNAFAPIVVTDAGILNEANAVQPLNADVPMDVTDP